MEIRVRPTAPSTLSLEYNVQLTQLEHMKQITGHG